MRTTESKRVLKRQAFPPFGVRLSNGAPYFFIDHAISALRKNFHMIFFFGQSETVRIDTKNIVATFAK